MAVSNPSPLSSTHAPIQEVGPNAQDKQGVPTWALPLQTLRRTGLRPLSFHGTTAATACGITPALPYWYELNVHRTVTGAYVSDIRLFRKDPNLPDLFRVAEHGDLEEMIGHLEGYDPSGDLASTPEMPEGTSNAALTLRAARLQIEINRITEHYRAMVCVLLGAVMLQVD